MRKISKELHKNYLILIFLFIFSNLSILFFLSNYVQQEAEADIETVNKFLKHEFSEFEKELKQGEKIEKLFDDALQESPKISGISIGFRYRDKVYSENDEEIFEKIKVEKENKIGEIGRYKYRYLKSHNILGEIGDIETLIIKDMEYERELLYTILKFSLIIILLTSFIGVVIFRRLYNSFNISLIRLQTITNRVSIDNLKEEKEVKEKYIEFEEIIDSYNKMLRRLNKQTKSQIEFVNSASHELKTPIFIISGYINMIKRWGLKNKELVEEALIAVEKEAKNMEGLVSKLLFLAKEDEMRIEKERVNIKLLIKGIVKDLKIIYPHQEFELLLRDEIIESDIFLLKQLFINIIENAIKYGRNKKITILTSFDENKVVVKIVDRGEGISKENLDKIYEKFYRVDKARSRESGSHGLGLAIVKKIAYLLNIELNIESELENGTTVNIILLKKY